MKSTTLILLSLAVTGLVSPVYCQDAQPAAPAGQTAADNRLPELESICEEIVNSQERCTAAVVAVKDAETAASAAKVLCTESENLANLRSRGLGLFPEFAGNGIVPPEAEAVEMDLSEALDALCADMEGKVDELLAMDPAFYGCKELDDALNIYTAVVYYALPAEFASTLQAIEQQYVEHNLIRYEAFKAIASVHDRASADAASAKLAELMERLDANFEALRKLLSQLPESEDSDFCQSPIQLRRLKSCLPKDFDEASAAASEKIQGLEEIDPPFYGSPELQERASNFILMPR